MGDQLRVDTVELRRMAGIWEGSTGELSATPPSGPGLPCQASAAAVAVAHGDVEAFTAALAARVRSRAAGVAEADARYVANESGSSHRLAV